MAIFVFDSNLKDGVRTFIDSWDGDDVYDRFGCAGIGGQRWLTTELTEHDRPALVAVDKNRVVGLLDHIRSGGVTHFGIVVDWRFRKQCIGTALVQTLLHLRSATRPIVAECSTYNAAAVALLRACRFKVVGRDPHQMTWQHE